MTTPGTASTSDARKRLAEPTQAAPDADGRGATEEPIDVGWYAYSGGRQSMIFHLRATGQWSAHFADGTASDCAWGYIEQALGVWDLVPLTPSRTPDAHLAGAKAVGAAEALADLQERLVAAEQRIAELTYPYWQKQDSARLEGKRQGVQLALSYVEEAARLREQGDPDAVLRAGLAGWGVEG